MLSEDQQTTLLAAIGIAILVLIGTFAAYSGNQSREAASFTQADYNQATENKPNYHANQYSPLSDWWNWITKDSVSFFTFVLAIFTGILAVVSILQGVFLYRADGFNRDSLTSVQRAFLFIKTIETHVVNEFIIIMPLWENSGATPAEEQRMCTSCCWFLPDQIPQDFYVFDFVDGKLVPSDRARADIAFIGPRTTQYAAHLPVPLAVLEETRLGHMRLFVWGWTEYKDTFPKTPTHRTEFCSEMIVIADMTIVPSEGRKIALRFTNFGPYNRAR
jgi:hypothetical protein